MRAMFLALIVLLPQVAEACGRCGRNPCVYSYPTVRERVFETVKVVPTDHSITFNLTFPPPVVSGSTVYQYQQPLYGAFDPMEAIRLQLHNQSRAMDLAQYMGQTASVTIQQSASVAELQQKAELFKSFERIVQSTGPSQTLSLTASRDATGRLTISPGGVAEYKSVPEIVAAKCVRCHQPGGEHEALDLRDLSALDDSWEPLILDRITTAEPGKRMPKGGSLSSGEIAAFYRASSICGKPKEEPLPLAAPKEQAKP